MFEKQIKRIVKLHQKKYRDAEGAYLVEGKKGVEEALKYPGIVEQIMFGPQFDDMAFRLNLPTEIVTNDLTPAEVTRVKTTDTFPGIMAVVKKQPADDFKNGPIVCLDRIADPGNLGTIIRTADWFGISQILLSEDSVDPYNPKSVRSTMGSIFDAKIIRSRGLVREINHLKEKGYNAVSLVMNGKPINELKAEPNTIYIFGSESHGVREEIMQLSTPYTIPGKGGAESLNVAIAAGILLSRL